VSGIGEPFAIDGGVVVTHRSVRVGVFVHGRERSSLRAMEQREVGLHRTSE
jgi:hypothetical protein